MNEISKNTFLRNAIMVKLRHWLTFGNNISNIYFGIGDPYLTHESNIVNMGYAAGNGPNNIVKWLIFFLQIIFAVLYLNHRNTSGKVASVVLN